MGPRGTRDRMHGIVERRAQEIVHGRVGDHKSLRSSAFRDEHAHEQYARVCDERTTGFHEHVAIDAPKLRGERLGVLFEWRRILSGVAHAEAPANIHVTQGNTGALQSTYITRQLADRFAIGRNAQDLRTDVRADSLPRDPFRIAMRQIELPSVLPVNSEFVVMLSGGNVGMRAGFDIGIHAQRGRRRPAQTGGFGGKHLKLRSGFHIEEQDARPQCGGDFLAGLTDSGKYDAFAFYTRTPQTLEFPAGNDIEAAAKPG